jgi:transcriptional regulator GlxA family with amidase domain
MLPAYADRLLTHLRVVTAASLHAPDFTPSALAVAAELSERTLYRRLKELTGLAPAAWLREARLLRAQQLLVSGAYRTVAEVAAATGFGGAGYFGQLYFRRFGHHPGEHRARLTPGSPLPHNRPDEPAADSPVGQ